VKKQHNKSETTSEDTFAVNFIEEKDVFRLLLNQMQHQLVQIKEQEIAIIKEKTSSLLQGEERERERISKELHDGIGQMLTAIKLMSNAIKGQDDVKIELKKMIDETIAETRRISFNLMPSVLLNFGLIPSVKILCENAEKYSMLKINHSLTESELINNITFEKKVTLYRLIQEAINNILKHANASNVFIKIENDIHNIFVQIQDNGNGFEIDKAKKKVNGGKGLSNMFQRAELCGGICTIDSQLGTGTNVNITIPL
jgi:two-component system NarL family sensor kinase